VAVSGFWSYARLDDEAEDGRVRSLTHLIAAEYRLLTTEPLELFVDRDSIAWGDAWREAIDNAIAGVTFFIPIVTPTYFTRDECRRELLAFLTTAAAAGVPELVLPILYVPVDDLRADSEDELKRLIANINYEPWDVLRLVDAGSADHRSGVHRLAARLKDLTAVVSTRPTPDPPSSSDPDQLVMVRESITNLGRSTQDIAERSKVDPSATEAPGFLDVLAEGEEALPRLNATTERIAEVMQQVGELAQKTAETTARSDAAGKGFAGRITAARSLARALAKPAQEVLDLGKDYASQLLLVDAAFRTLIEMSDLQAAAGISADEKAAICEFFEAMRGMAREADSAIGEVITFSAILGDTASASRDLRAPARLIQDGLRYFSDGQAVIREWVRLIDESAIDCSPSEATAPS
jgi:hypothetical protein